jgi:hypothetical protein
MLGVEHSRGTSAQRRINSEYTHGNSRGQVISAIAGSHRPDFGHIGYEMTQQILDAVPQRRR